MHRRELGGERCARMESVVKNGPLAGVSLAAIVERYKELLLGNAVYEKYGTLFPVLVKYIDAVQDLSVQVHPDDALAGSATAVLARAKCGM